MSNRPAENAFLGFLNSTLSLCWLYPVVIFNAICLVPWFPSMSGDPLLPLGTAYVNHFEGWQKLLLAHVLITLALAGVATAIHLAIHHLVKSRLDRPPAGTQGGPC